MEIGKLRRVPLREVWKHEALNFTTWLQENIDILNEVIDFELSNAEREQSAGSFNVDIVAEDETGNPVIIENQFGKSDHDHLGKLITYRTAFDASVAIWIVETPRPEHISAITWLNESSSGSFYLIKVEAVRVGNSPAAPLLTLIVGPSEEGREIGKTKKELAERYIIRRKFWTSLIARAKDRTKLHANIAPSKNSSISTVAGKSGLNYSYVIRQHDAQVDLYIDRGKESQDENKSIFDAFYSEKHQIEDIFGVPLDWQRFEDKRGSRIRFIVQDGGYRAEKWDTIQDAMIDAMIRLEQAMKPHITKLKI